MPLFGGGKAKKEEEARRAAFEQAVWGSVDKKLLHEKAIEAINESVIEGERIVAIIPGAHDQAIVASTKRIYVYKKGMMGGTSGGQKLATWEYRGIYGVQYELGRVSGFVALQTPGSDTQDTSYWSNDKNSPSKAANAIPIVKDKKVDYPTAVRALRTAIDQATAGT